MRKALVSAVVVAGAVLIGCGSEPVEFPDWTVPVRPDTPVIEYVGVPLGERTESLSLSEDLAIDGRDGDAEKIFYNPITVSIDPESARIYVYDAGNYRIQVFEPDGTFTRSFGRSGSGPGELGRGGRVTITDGHVVHIGLEGMNVWDLEGNVVRMVSPEFRQFSDIIGLPGGSLLGFTWERPDRDTRLKLFRRIDLEANVEHRYMSLSDNGSPTFRRPGRTLNSLAPVGSPQAASGAHGDLYFTGGDEYQVLATDVDGEARWALRVAWSRLPLTDEEIDALVARVQERMPDASRDEIDWPTHKPALVRVGSLQVDGHGHVFVFPYYPEDWPEESQPVDVYSADGDLLFSGSMPRIRWRAAHDDSVYALQTDTETEEVYLARYRLTEPWPP